MLSSLDALGRSAETSTFDLIHRSWLIGLVRLSGGMSSSDLHQLACFGRFNSPETLIVGRRGRLARAFAFIWPAASVVGSDRLDITNRANVLGVLEGLNPRLVVNCAAITDIKRCEADTEAAWAVNVRGVRNLAEASRALGATFVHFSSDYALDPVNEYGWTKRASEALADLTIRAKVYDASHWAWLALKQGRTVEMTTLEYCNPITTTGVAATTAEVLSRGLRGIISVGTAERLNFWQVGRIWATVLGVSPELVQSIGDVPSSIPRLTEMFLSPAALIGAGIAVSTVAADAAKHLQCYSHYGSKDADV